MLVAIFFLAMAIAAIKKAFDENDTRDVLALFAVAIICTTIAQVIWTKL